MGADEKVVLSGALNIATMSPPGSNIRPRINSWYAQFWWLVRCEMTSQNGLAYEASQIACSDRRRSLRGGADNRVQTSKKGVAYRPIAEGHVACA